ncbi:MAG TPA: PfkB family carbohydrate kinase [Candidatus Dormibacteraeota bacterium]|jgi:1-phosphofructokinase family hexose kinase|nr:PfkB family carbohydrate kinase [Candidatus Dormibacteraeota bacterium]
MLIAGPNLTIDRTQYIDEIRPGDVLRFRRVEVTPGGKGVNVARVARAFGHVAVLIGFAAGRTGAAVTRMIADEGLRLVDVSIGGEIRATSVVIEDSGRTTVFNEPGPALAAGDWTAFEESVLEYATGHRVLALCGSVPPEAPIDAYARLVAIGRDAGLTTIVDATGLLLEAAVAAGPDIVTPNLVEARLALDEDGLDPGGAAERLCGRGAAAAIVTDGGRGLALRVDGETEWIPAPRVEVRNGVGAGDSLVAGLGMALERGLGTREAALQGMAAAVASVETDVAGEVRPERVAEIRRMLPGGDG